MKDNKKNKMAELMGYAIALMLFAIVLVVLAGLLKYLIEFLF